MIVRKIPLYPYDFLSSVRGVTHKWLISEVYVLKRFLSKLISVINPNLYKLLLNCKGTAQVLSDHRRLCDSDFLSVHKFITVRNEILNFPQI